MNQLGPLPRQVSPRALLKVEYVPDDFAVVVPHTVVASETELFEYSEGWCVPYAYS